VRAAVTHHRLRMRSLPSGRRLDAAYTLNSAEPPRSVSPPFGLNRSCSVMTGLLMASSRPRRPARQAGAAIGASDRTCGSQVRPRERQRVPAVDASAGLLEQPEKDHVVSNSSPAEKQANTPNTPPCAGPLGGRRVPVSGRADYPVEELSKVWDVLGHWRQDPAGWIAGRCCRRPLGNNRSPPQVRNCTRPSEAGVRVADHARATGRQFNELPAQHAGGVRLRNIVLAWR